MYACDYLKIPGIEFLSKEEEGFWVFLTRRDTITIDPFYTHSRRTHQI